MNSNFPVKYQNDFLRFSAGSSIPMAIVSASGLNLESANPSMLSLVGETEDFIGTSLTFASTKIKAVLVPDQLEEVIESGLEKQIRRIPVHTAEIEKYFDLVLSPVRGLEGIVIGVSIIAFECTPGKEDVERIEESELRFRNLVLEADVATGIYIGEEMRIEIANEAMIKLWGKDVSVIRKTIKDALPELEGQPFHDLLAEVYRTGITYKAKEDKVDLVVDGRLQSFYFNFTYKALRKSNGEVYGILNMAVDVTEQVLARQRALESESKFRDLITQAPVGMAVLQGPNFKIDIANAETLEIWSRDQKVIGKEIAEVFPELIAQGILDILRAVYETGKPFYGNEYPVQIQSGGELINQYVNFVYHPIIENGTVSSILSLGYNVTDLVASRKIAEESERMLREQANSMPQQVWAATPDGNLTFINEVACEYFGLSEADLREKGWLEFIHPRDLKDFIGLWESSKTTGQHYEVEYQLKGKNEHYRSFLGRAVPIKNSENQIIRWIGTNTDIDELKMLQRQKDDFLGIASHELKTPLTTLKAYTQVLERMLDKEADIQKANFVSKMNNQLNRLNALIADLLDVTKIQRGKLEFNDAFFDFDELVKEVVDELQHSTKHSLELHLNPTGQIFADRDRIRQVISNLVTNAIKYSPKADRVLISSVTKADTLEFCVEDFGIGIPEDKKEKVFEQFYRVNTVKEYNFPGLGLGLYISAEIIKREKGKIWMNSVLGKGSTFCFSLLKGKERMLDV